MSRCCPECVQAAETGIQSSQHPGRDLRNRFFNADLPGAFWRLREFQRSGIDAVCPQLCFGLCHQRRSRRGPRACGSDGRGPGTSSTRSGTVGLRLPTHVAGGSTDADVVIQRGGFSTRKGEGLLTLVPSEVGDHCPCLCERNRFYTGKESGPSKAASRSTACSCSSLSQKEMGGGKSKAKGTGGGSTPQSAEAEQA